MHSLVTLETLNRYSDFMDNIATVADMGCGIGLDARWWAELTTPSGQPRNIKVNAVDLVIDPMLVARHSSIRYIRSNFNDTTLSEDSQDLVWAHNSLHLSPNPMDTLTHWWSIMKTDAMLVLTLPYNFYIDNHRGIQKVDTMYHFGSYFNWTMGNMIMSLAATGFDVRDSHFRFDREEGWIHAAVYKSVRAPDPSMNWYEMCEKKILPICIESAIMRTGTFRETDIVCDWIDRSQYILAV